MCDAVRNGRRVLIKAKDACLIIHRLTRWNEESARCVCVCVCVTRLGDAWVDQLLLQEWILSYVQMRRRWWKGRKEGGNGTREEGQREGVARSKRADERVKGTRVVGLGVKFAQQQAGNQPPGWRKRSRWTNWTDD